MKKITLWLAMAGLLFVCQCYQEGNGASDTTEGAPADGPDSTEEGPAGDPDIVYDPRCEGYCEFCGTECLSDAECVDADPCTLDRCVPGCYTRCQHDPIDEDGDGYAAIEGPGGVICDGTDCNDHDPLVFPGAIARDCSPDIDHDCDTVPDSGEGIYKIGEEVKVSDDEGESSWPGLQWTGSEFAVTWQHFEDSTVPYDIFFARLSPTGERIGSVKSAVHASRGSIDLPMVPSLLQWTGSEFGLAWMEFWTTPTEMSCESAMFTILSAEGDRLGSDLELSPPDCLHSSGIASLQWTGSEFGLIWLAAEDSVYFTRISASGEKIGSDIRLTQLPVQTGPIEIRWTGTEYGMAWYYMESIDSEIHFSRISPSGEWLGTDTTIGTWGQSFFYDQTPIEWTGSAFGLLRDEQPVDTTSVFFSLLSPSGEIIYRDVRVDTFPLYEGAFCGAFKWIDTSFALSWTENTLSYQSSIFFTLLSESGEKISDSVPISYNDGLNYYSSLTWTGSELGVAWWSSEDSTGDTGSHIFTRLRPCP